MSTRTTVPSPKGSRADAGRPSKDRWTSEAVRSPSWCPGCRTREANLAFYEDRIQWAMREFREWRDYMTELERQLGREPTTTPLDFP